MTAQYIDIRSIILLFFACLILFLVPASVQRKKSWDRFLVVAEYILAAVASLTDRSICIVATNISPPADAGAHG